MKLWQSGGEQVASEAEQFLASDLETDQLLAPYDILGSIAHAQMLHEQGYLSSAELGELHAALHDLYGDPPGITPAEEDVHTAVEQAVTERTAAGAKLHTGRSRNDQVAVDEHLYLKDALPDLALATLDLAEALAETGDDTPMPGRTHDRSAMPTTAETWLGGHAAALLDDLELLSAAHATADANPLGAAAGYGTTLDLDRGRTAELLGFAEVADNPVHAAGMRGRTALFALDAAEAVMLDLSRLAADLVKFSAPAHGFVELPGEFTTGSSIMPQKENPDIPELVQGKAAAVTGSAATVRTALAGATSGYGRESQVAKPAMVDGVATATASAAVMADLVEGMDLDRDAMEDAVEPAVFAAHTANAKVEDGVPFREAYRQVKQEQDYEQGEIPTFPVDADAIASARDEWRAEQDAFAATVEDLLALAAP